MTAKELDEPAMIRYSTTNPDEAPGKTGQVALADAPNGLGGESASPSSGEPQQFPTTDLPSLQQVQLGGTSCGK